MPLEECLWLDDDQSLTPIEESGEQDHYGARGRGRTSRPRLAFLKQSELFAKEQVLRNDGSARGNEQPDERKQPTFYKSVQAVPTTRWRSDLIIAENSAHSPLQL
jgi:hypothetical protein